MAKSAYSFLSFNCAIVGPGGAISLGNGAGAADEGITFTPSVDANNMEVGPDGTGQHSMNNDKSGTVSLTLLKTSPVNQQLMAMLAFQRSNPANWGQNIISGVDSVRGDAVTCQQVAFKRVPNVKQAKVAGTNEWTFDVIQMDIALGG